MSDFVGGEEEDSRIELEDTEEDRDDAVAAHVFAVTGLEEDVCFVKLDRWVA